MRCKYSITLETAAPVAAVLYWRIANGLSINNKPLARTLDVPEQRIRFTKLLYCIGQDNTMKLPIAKIRRDGGTQSREAIPKGAVEHYAELLTDGKPLPPIDVFYDGTNYWLGDGFIRTKAHEVVGLRDIEVQVHQGALRDAVLFSCGANATHGHPRTNADKRRAVMTLLNDEEWSQWSSREIARRCGVSDMAVRRYKEESMCDSVAHSDGESSEAKPRETVLNCRNGTVYEQKIAKKKPKEEAVEFSEEPLVEQPWSEPEPVSPPVDRITINHSPKTETANEFALKCEASQFLSPECQTHFLNELSFFQAMLPEITRLRDRYEVALKQYSQTTTSKGPYVLLVRMLLASSSPRTWSECRACVDDYHISQGHIDGEECDRCGGLGFIIPQED